MIDRMKELRSLGQEFHKLERIEICVGLNKK